MLPFSANLCWFCRTAVGRSSGHPVTTSSNCYSFPRPPNPRANKGPSVICPSTSETSCSTYQNFMESFGIIGGNSSVEKGCGGGEDGFNRTRYKQQEEIIILGVHRPQIYTGVFYYVSFTLSSSLILVPCCYRIYFQPRNALPIPLSAPFIPGSRILIPEAQGEVKTPSGPKDTFCSVDMDFFPQCKPSQCHEEQCSSAWF